MDAILTLDHHVDKLILNIQFLIYFIHFRRGFPLNLIKRLDRIHILMSQRDDLDRFYQALFHNFTDFIKITNAQV